MYFVTQGYYYLPRQLLLDGLGSAVVFINSCLMTQVRLTLSLSVQSRADGYFTFREIDRRHVAVILSKSVQDLTDQSKPTSDIRWVLQLHNVLLQNVQLQNVQV
jgi:hypothetical protein